MRKAKGFSNHYRPLCCTSFLLAWAIICIALSKTRHTADRTVVELAALLTQFVININQLKHPTWGVLEQGRLWQWEMCFCAFGAAAHRDSAKPLISKRKKKNLTTSKVISSHFLVWQATFCFVCGLCCQEVSKSVSLCISSLSHHPKHLNRKVMF